MYTAAKIALLLLSVMGYAMLYKRRRLPVCFFPAALISGVVAVLYIFGLLGLLKVGSYAVLLGGLAALAWLRDWKGLREVLTDRSILFALFSAVWLYVITRGETLSHWDDGSHWYRICKSLFYENAFPTTPDILYYDYVPGCQVWVYFMVHVIGFTIPNCLFAQGLINVACTAALFAAMANVKNRAEKLITVAVIAAASVALCCMTVTTYVLLVDLQMGLVAMSALIFMLDQGEKREAYVPLMLMLTFLMLIKNSGVLFALMIVVWAVIRYRYKGRRLACRLVGWIGVPAAAYGLYAIRARAVYHGAADALQGMSAERFASILGEKDAETIRLFTQRFIKRLFVGDATQPMQSTGVYICALLLILLFIGMKKEGKLKHARQVLQSMIGGACMLAVYAVALYFTYLLTMNTHEALVVKSFFRYYAPIVIILVGMTVYVCISQISLSGFGGEGGARIYVLCMLLFAMLAVPGALSKRYILGSDYYYPGQYEPKLWRTMEYYVWQNQYYTDESYAVLWDEEEFVESNMGVEFDVGAWVRSDDVTAISSGDLANGLEEAQKAALAGCDHLVLLSDMSPDKELLSEYVSLEDLSKGMWDRQPDDGFAKRQ